MEQIVFSVTALFPPATFNRRPAGLRRRTMVEMGALFIERDQRSITTAKETFRRAGVTGIKMRFVARKSAT
jgi:hypothetical protein